ncbi:MAG: hypothetical protein BroJett003_08770 [Planctomycetota bacterium]|nr:MAG: hypothetical protein BroJett003_08770 [Planctomycetota bacterium]
MREAHAPREGFDKIDDDVAGRGFAQPSLQRRKIKRHACGGPPMSERLQCRADRPDLGEDVQLVRSRVRWKLIMKDQHVHATSRPRLPPAIKARE